MSKPKTSTKKKGDDDDDDDLSEDESSVAASAKDDDLDKYNRALDQIIKKAEMLSDEAKKLTDVVKSQEKDKTKETK